MYCTYAYVTGMQRLYKQGSKKEKYLWSIKDLDQNRHPVVHLVERVCIEADTTLGLLPRVVSSLVHAFPVPCFNLGKIWSVQLYRQTLKTCQLGLWLLQMQHQANTFRCINSVLQQNTKEKKRQRFVLWEEPLYVYINEAACAFRNSCWEAIMMQISVADDHGQSCLHSGYYKKCQAHSRHYSRSVLC